MDILIFAQTIFYFSFSLVIIVTGALLVIFLYHVVSISKHLHHGLDNFTEISSGILDKVNSLFGRLVGAITEAINGNKKKSKKK